MAHCLFTLIIVTGRERAASRHLQNQLALGVCLGRIFLWSFHLLTDGQPEEVEASGIGVELFTAVLPVVTYDG